MATDNPESGNKFTAEQAMNVLAIVNEFEGRLTAMRVHLLNILAEAHQTYEATMITMMTEVRNALAAQPAEPPTNEERPTRLN